MYGKTYEITVQEKTEGKNSIGGITESWTDKGTVKGKIWMLTGEERYESARFTGIIKYRMACDIPSFEITRNERIQYDGTTYKIEVVNDVDKLGKRYQIDLLVVD